MLAELFADHIKQKYRCFTHIMMKENRDHLLISSGEKLTQFCDDQTYPFKVNPYFKEWLPLLQHPDAYLLISASDPKPKVFMKSVADYWHSRPAGLPNGWDTELELIEYVDDQALLCNLPDDRHNIAFIGCAGRVRSCFDDRSVNPQQLMNRIDWQRAVKTPYEIACLREANIRAARGHLAAEQAFHRGCSELDVLLAFLQAGNCAEMDLPYDAIVAFNEHAAVLHHNILQTQQPAVSRSCLIDAGVDYNGYAADITRTCVTQQAGRETRQGQSVFTEMIAALDVAQQQICSGVKAGASFVDLHNEAHRQVAKILCAAGVLKCAASDAVQMGLTTPFFPHGLGHLLGVQVHDRGGHQARPEGGHNPPPANHPHLRLTRTLEASQVLTIEPGIYFIPMLLEPLRAGKMQSEIDWQLVDALMPYGGIRIEDNVVVGESGCENLTRQGFERVKMEGQ